MWPVSFHKCSFFLRLQFHVFICIVKLDTVEVMEQSKDSYKLSTFHKFSTSKHKWYGTHLPVFLLFANESEAER